MWIIFYTDFSCKLQINDLEIIHQSENDLNKQFIGRMINEAKKGKQNIKRLPATKCHHILCHFDLVSNGTHRTKPRNRLINFDKMFVDCWCDCKIPLWYISLSRASCSSGMLNFNSFSVERTEMWCCCCFFCYGRCWCMQSLFAVWHRFQPIFNVWVMRVTCVCVCVWMIRAFRCATRASVSVNGRANKQNQIKTFISYGEKWNLTTA